MEALTPKEEEIMKILWNLKKGFVNDVIEKLQDPKPPYTTISSVIRTLEKKGFVSHKAYGKIHEYYPAVTKLAYKRFVMKSVMEKYFDNSFQKVVSFMVEEKALSEEEREEIRKLIQQNTPDKND